MSVSLVEKCTICFMNVAGINGYLRHIRQVHGNDRQFGTHCPLCDSKFVFTYLKSFIHHIRKHVLYSSPDKEASSSLLLNHDEINININDENEQQSLYEYEQHNPLEEIKKYYIKMLLKVREGHVLPGNVMKTMIPLIREINLHSDPFDGDIVQALESTFIKLIKKVDHQEKENITKEEQPLFVLEHLIMKRYKHSRKLLLYHEAIDAHPMIRIQTDKNIKNYSIVIEYNTIVMTNSLVEAIAVLIGSYEIFNIEYPAKVRTTLEVLNGLAFKKRSFSLSLAAKRFLNEHKLNNRAG